MFCFPSLRRNTPERVKERVSARAHQHIHTNTLTHVVLCMFNSVLCNQSNRTNRENIKSRNPNNNGYNKDQTHRFQVSSGYHSLVCVSMHATCAHFRLYISNLVRSYDAEFGSASNAISIVYWTIISIRFYSFLFSISHCLLFFWYVERANFSNAHMCATGCGNGNDNARESVDGWRATKTLTKGLLMLLM